MNINLQRQSALFQTDIDIDIDAEAARTLSSAARAVRHILNRRRALDLAGQYDVPLAVILGESHDNPAHAAHHLLVLNGLKDWSQKEKATARTPGSAPLILCHELEHGSLKQVFKHIADAPAKGAAQTHLTANDPQGKMNAKTYLGFFALFQGDFSKAALLRAAQKNDILNFLTDCDKNDGGLDADDPSTAAAIAACRDDSTVALTTPIDPTSEEGVRIRNHHMAQKALQYAQIHRARIILQPCGNAHVVGVVDLETGAELYKAADSLSAMFKEQGAAVLAMPQTGIPLKTLDISPHHTLKKTEAGAMEEVEFFGVEALPNHSAAYNPFTNQPITAPGTPAAFISRSEEASYLNALLARAGFSEAMLSLDDYFQKRAQDYLELQQYCAAASAAATPKIA